MGSFQHRSTVSFMHIEVCSSLLLYSHLEFNHITTALSILFLKQLFYKLRRHRAGNFHWVGIARFFSVEVRSGNLLGRKIERRLSYLQNLHWHCAGHCVGRGEIAIYCMGSVDL